MNDVVIIGGGPAGSAIGCYLSRAGIQNVILESNNHPRAHVGESMVTSSTRIFKELDFLKTMETEAFVQKYGASWHEPGGKEFGIRFGEFPQEGIDQIYTYHVDRSKLDLLLLKHAQSMGSQVVQGVTVKQVLFDENNKASGVRASIAGQEVDIPARFVVDASGRGTVIGRQLNLKKMDPIFDQYAVHAWFEDVDRGPEESWDYIHIYFLPVERGWAWQIPITETITSVGIVAERDIFRQSRKDVEGYFDTYVQSNPALAKAMQPARRINEWKTEGDYSYSMKQFVGDGFLLVGDAARFVDPIFSSGVSIALYSAKYASETIRAAFDCNDFSTEFLMPYETRLRSGVDVWYQFIRLYYRLLPLFTHFIQSKKYRVEVLRLLQGEVFDRTEVGVLDAMRRYIDVVEKNENHMLRGALADIPIDDIIAMGQD
jgi:1H-pyrrole-2-carbonyl-[peptidyl-carrier protein] chlorinase